MAEVDQKLAEVVEVSTQKIIKEVEKKFTFRIEQLGEKFQVPQPQLTKEDVNQMIVEVLSSESLRAASSMPVSAVCLGSGFGKYSTINALVADRQNLECNLST